MEKTCPRDNWLEEALEIGQDSRIVVVPVRICNTVQVKLK